MRQKFFTFSGAVGRKTYAGDVWDVSRRCDMLVLLSAGHGRGRFASVAGLVFELRLLVAVAGVAAVVQGVNEHCAVNSRLRCSWGKWCEAPAAPATAAAAVVTESQSRSC